MDGSLLKTVNHPIILQCIKSELVMKHPEKFHCIQERQNHFWVIKLAFVFYLYFCWSYQIMLSQPMLLPGFPKIIDQSSIYLPGTINTQVADINNDGIEDIVIKGFTPPYKLFVIQIDGSNLTGWPVTMDGEAMAIGIGDIDNDGKLEVVARSHHKLYVWHNDGRMANGFPQTLTGNTFPDFSNTILLYDIDNDSRLEIITTTYNQIRIHNWDGSMHAGWPITLSEKWASNPAISNVDKSGTPEIILGGSTVASPPGVTVGKLYVFSSNGEIFPGWPKLLDSNYIPSNYATIADVDNDDSLEIIFTQSLRVEDSSAGEIYARVSMYSSSGLLKQQWNIPPDNSWRDLSGVSVANFNQDAFLEIATVNYMGTAYLFTYDGTVLPGWPKFKTATYPIPILSDIDNDSIPEIIIGHYRSVNDTGKLFFYNSTGDSLRWSPLGIYGNTGFQHPIISDLNHDGKSEMVITSDAGYPLIKSVLSVYTFPHSAFSPKTSPWPQREHDRHNTYQYGYIPSDNVVSVPSFERAPLQFSLSQNYPNPFNPSTMLSFVIGQSSFVTLKIFNVLGKEIATLIHSRLMDAGKHEVNFDGSNVPSGIYYYRLTAGKFTETKKFVVVR